MACELGEMKCGKGAVSFISAGSKNPLVAQQAPQIMSELVFGSSSVSLGAQRESAGRG